MSSTSWIGIVGAILGVLFGVAGVVAVVILLGRQKALESSLSLFGLANGELRAQVESARDERVRMSSDFEQRLADERAECARVTGHLQGQLTVLTGNLGRDIASSVLQAVADLSTQLEGARKFVADKVDAVGDHTRTANGSTMGELADQAEGRRIHVEIPRDEQTDHERGYDDREQRRR